jgi:LacI family transcriptional regulator
MHRSSGCGSVLRPPARRKDARTRANAWRIASHVDETLRYFTGLVIEALQMDSPRVLVFLDSDRSWSRGILRGFTEVAHERGWTVLRFDPHYPPPDLDWLKRQFAPAAAVVGPELLTRSMDPLAPAAVVSVAADRSSEGIASACLDEEAIAALALEHLLAKGLRHVTTFRIDNWRFAVERERAFIEHACAAGIAAPAGWVSGGAGPHHGEEPAAIREWLLALPKPCGIFTCSDAWAGIVAGHIRLAGLRVPEDVSLIGVDNDVTECELLAPPLTSVMIPWREVGSNAAQLVRRALSGNVQQTERMISTPVAVFARCSTDILAIDDSLVATAVRWIRQHADRRLSVPMVAHAVGGGRQRLERRFRRVLDRTVLEEIRRVRVDAAKELLQTTRADLTEIAKRSGFTSAALLSVAFQREIGMAPGTYRRRVLGALPNT